ncbi:uncharacterized protein LOC123295972 [Chrysoperla carnea]|uniref:uncharacterized protein LOC123295972 n=1 Tax=Chrysoperla carnea TaxID=189513 RepID=UPI001D06FCA1|nr:uncharacterized protein LOC123295972 [Chrysoperla carnea]
MVLNARCRTCGESFEHKPQCPCLLGRHVVFQHPCTNITHFTCKLNPGPDFKRFNCKKNKNIRKIIECWKPGSSLLHCQKCCKDVSPIIRRRRNRITRTFCGALIVLGCWPLCFLPCILNCFDQSNVYLYCPCCMQYLGRYRRREGVVIMETTENRPCCARKKMR